VRRADPFSFCDSAPKTKIVQSQSINDRLHHGVLEIAAERPDDGPLNHQDRGQLLLGFRNVEEANGAREALTFDMMGQSIGIIIKPCGTVASRVDPCQ
jgi:hypothetical protein